AGDRTGGGSALQLNILFSQSGSERSTRGAGGPRTGVRASVESARTATAAHRGVWPRPSLALAKDCMTGNEMQTISIEDSVIGKSQPAYIVAEMSANHGQRFDNAVELVRAAKEAGADAIKLQTYTPDTLTIDSANEYFQIGKGTLWEGKNLYQLYGEA